MALFNVLCPHSPNVWSATGVSKCFDDLFLGLGVNLISVILVAALAITKRNARANIRINPAERIPFQVLPVIGALVACIDIGFLLRTTLNGYPVMYHKWLLRLSQLLFWVTILLVSKCKFWFIVFSDWLMCIWWIVKACCWVPHLQAIFYSLEAVTCLKESLRLLLEVMFGISIILIKMKRASLKSSLGEDLLLSHELDIENGQQLDHEKAQNIWQLMSFEIISSVLQRGAGKQLDFEDLLELPADMDPLSCHLMLLSCWERQRKTGHPSLFRAFCSAYGWSYISLGLLKILNDCLGFGGPLLLNKLIRFLQEGGENFDGYIFAISLGLTSILKSFLDTQYTFHLSKLKLKLRSSIMATIFRKCLCVSLAERSKFSEGEIQTYMSVDADRSVNLCNSLHDMWSLPLQIGVALYLLYTQVKFAFVSGIAITILLIPVNKWIAEAIADATRSMMKQKDERIRRTGELLTYIRTLKMYGWELLFSSWLIKTRSSEVSYLSTRKYLDAWCVFFWATTPTLFSFCTFGLYALMGNQLDAATVFTCLALFNNLISPLNSFPWVINGLIDATISTGRLSRFLCCPEIETATSSDNYASSCTDEYPCVSFEDVAVVINEACCLWCSNDQEQLVMDHVTLSVPKGHLIAVVGEVGSGKSSLLNSILRETKIINGFVHTSGSIAYVPQVPWILSGSIRDNVILGDEYDPRRLSDVLEACALDIDVFRMTGGDLAFIGEKGLNLSGGQRARLALARAVYHDPDIYLLDDVLSAVDAEVAQWIISNAILGPLMSQKTRILCTHNAQAISSADTVVLIDKGRVRLVGSPSQSSVSSYIPPSLREDLSISSEVQSEDNDVDAQKKVLLESDDICVSEEAPCAIEVEQRKEGRVEVVTYKNYAVFCGWSVTILTCLSAIFMQASRNGNDLWLSYWVDTTGVDKQKDRTSFYLVVLCIFCVMNSSFTLVRAFSFAFGGLRAAVQVHDRLLKNLVDAPVHFFDQTPTGRILNRLSSDLYTIDDSLPFILNILLANFVGLLGIAIVLSYTQVMFLLLLLPFWYVYNKLQLYYRSTSRELRRLDSVARSPIYASFTEILNGSSTIRAFKTEDFFFARFTENVILYQRTSYSEIIANLWLSLRLQILAAVIVCFVAVMAVVGSRGHLLISFGSPGKVGLALSYAAPAVSLLGNFLTSFTETEKELVSVERVLQYMDVATEELHECQLLDTEWPLHGNIEFQNVTLKYRPSLPAALCDLTCTFAGGTQTGIVGRTGAGKSSILNVLFRLNPLSGGCILVDGINIAKTSLRDLRTRFSVVPQTPFLFEGSLRDNLDPFRVNDDLKIWDALAKCQIEDEVRAMGGLDMHVKESGASFSVGQRQLLCLARAFLKSSKVLCLDECTANVDTSTALKLQNAITSKCRGITVITIAHRISTVLNMDTIFILDQGSLVEQGNPHVLLQDKMSRFSSFVEASTSN
ncbi:ABC transporter C family member 13 isoform X1 [Daucus carota subsp. sativus]|uniref:ABC transporter C family member 13 isoform X1 n=1 Tax=Daucus carota subsp. sativus TaxID=79200 RepID=UPI0007EFA3F8|nr:PREDICTED: ABC transporter C family member 13 isoform X1 [Daucus carota subsp. sativus]